MKKKSILIIGAGIAGLSAGCYAQMNGFESHIFEMHSLPGGLCTSWVRGDYLFDGCLDWLTGTAPDDMFYPLWEELDVISNNEFLYSDEYCRYVAGTGREIVFYLDPSRLEKELLSHAPGDAAAISELCDLIRTFKTFKPPVAKATEIMTVLDYIRMMPDMLMHLRQYRAFFKYGKVTMQNFAAKFNSPALKEMFEAIWNSSVPVSMFASTMAWCSNKTAGYPKGGSLKLSRTIEQKYLELGGSIHYRKRVREILVRDGKAVGVKLSDGNEVYSDIVISAADSHFTLMQLLGGQYREAKICSWYASSKTYPPYIQVSLGVKRDLAAEPRHTYRQLEHSISIGNSVVSTMAVDNYAFDSTSAPKGKTSLIVRFFTDYEYWLKLYEDKNAYKAEKNKLAEIVIGELDSIYPGIGNDIELIDIATPVTYSRYTGNWKGAPMGWLPTIENFGQSIEKTLTGLRNFYMAGQWLTPGGGVPNALKTGRDVIQLISKREGLKFNTKHA